MTIREEFARRSGRASDGVWSAPGRVNLIGEHLDYNGGRVLPFAIGLRTRVAAAARDDDRIRCWSLQDPDEVETTIDAAAGESGWAAYAAGTVWALRRLGAPVRGLDMLVDGSVPLGSGLSSSAALEAAVALAATELGGGPAADRLVLARAGQLAEHEVAGAPVGLMDQVASLFGREGDAVLFDSATTRHDLVPLPLADAGCSLLVIDTRVTHDLASSEYGVRRRQCEQAARDLGIDHLALASPDDLDRIDDDVVRRRARHVVTEQARVSSALTAIRRTDMAALGRLLVASHESLRDDFEVSVPELDATVEAALDAGALGARLTGGGFGGCVIALTAADRVDPVAVTVAARARTAGRPAPGFIDGAPRAGAGREPDPLSGSRCDRSDEPRPRPG